MLIEEAGRLGIGVSITPAATPASTHEVLARLKAHGVDGLGHSLDGSTASRHDSIRGVTRTFHRTQEAMKWAGSLQIPLQVNTLVSDETAGDIPAIYGLLKQFDVMRWSLFFLISVGRGKMLKPLSPEEGEKLMGWVYETSRVAPFVVATTEAPSYRRVALQKLRAVGITGEQIKIAGVSRSFGIRDGHGIMFVSSTGGLCPAGFLPAVAGNVRKDHIADVYRSSDLFQSLHDPTRFEGRCGHCEYQVLCGGSRARAYAATGNPLASDPFCDYEPHSKRRTV